MHTAFRSLVLASVATVSLGIAPVAQAASSRYEVVTTWFEPETQPNDTVFVGSFDFDLATHTVTNLTGRLSESMTGGGTGYPDDSMIWLTLGHQLVSWHDAALGGTFAATFRLSDTGTFTTAFGGDGWSPGEVVFAGYPNPAANPGNAYVLIFVPDDPVASLTAAQVDELAYADCAPGGMMGSTCMTGTSLAGHGLLGSMGGYPVSQSITAAVPEPQTWLLMLAGTTLLPLLRRRFG